MSTGAWAQVIHVIVEVIRDWKSWAVICDLDDDLHD
jgi:hypothetical protein